MPCKVRRDTAQLTLSLGSQRRLAFNQDFTEGPAPRVPNARASSGSSARRTAELVADAEDAGAPADVINLLKSMPWPQYGTFQEAQRDLGEASRRFAMGNQAAPEAGVNRDRRNLGRDAIENAPPGHTRHP